MNELLAGVRAELFLARYSLGTRLLVLTPVILASLQLLFAALGEGGAQAQQALLGTGSDQDASAGYGTWVDALVTGLTALGLLSVACSAHSFAAERDLGSLRHTLIRRLSRHSLVLSKLLSLHALVLLSATVLILGSWALSALLFELGPVIEDGYELISEEEIRQEIRLGLLLALLPLPAAIAFGLMLSVLAQSATQALALALGITLAFDVFKTSLGDWAAYFYARFQPSLIDGSYLGDVARLARGYSDVLLDERLLQLNYWAPWPALLAFLALCLLFVRRKPL